MLGRPVIALQAGEAQRRAGRHVACQGRRCLAGSGPATARTDVYFDIDVQGHRLCLRRGRQCLDLLRMIDQHADARAAGQGHQAAQLGVTYDLVGDQHILHAGIHENGCLADLLAAKAHRTQRDLAPRDLGAFVTLGMRTQAHTRAPQCAGHAVKVALEGVEVEHQCGRVDGT
jgi:hypothetical protein